MAGEAHFREPLADFVRRSSLQRAKAERALQSSNLFVQNLVTVSNYYLKNSFSQNSSTFATFDYEGA